ncbi:hypothetical protein BJ138DRAFT_520860 [Hygrophoropsis aurantiaca]|uniref:Uncharacterized protein n=1 Tax=Hygrophoropsis aurantiaca TaxID=72124 RepID=A0ACB8A157_9AGAM|nr:hypothetical protein BJ138DRAFT_520860 [Hygrophoropsis aurantiaca]
MVFHPGGIPRFSSQVAVFPDDKLGVVALANTETSGLAMTQIVDKVMSAVLPVTIPLSTGPSMMPPPPPQDRDAQTIVHTILPLEKYAGIYGSPGYGDLRLCGSAGQLDYCKKVVGDYALVKFALGRKTDSRFQPIAKWDNFRARNVRMEHRSGDSFSAKFETLFPQGYGANTTAFDFDNERHAPPRHHRYLRRGRRCRYWTRFIWDGRSDVGY